jgi:mono/diheme cytochrome c family protein
VAHGELVVGRHLRFTRPGDGAAAEGEKLVQRLGCRRCHVVAGRGNRLAASLDGAAARGGSASLVSALKRPAEAMPDFRLDDRQIDLLLTALYAGTARAGGGSEPPRRVHFRAGKAREHDPFAVKCGPCHRALTRGAGLLGQGGIGPDLSGLFSPFYPAAVPGGRPWNARQLGLWLKNPRSLRPWGLMRPVDVSTQELGRIVTTLDALAVSDGNTGP